VENNRAPLIAGFFAMFTCKPNNPIDRRLTNQVSMRCDREPLALPSRAAISLANTLTSEIPNVSVLLNTISTLSPAGKGNLESLLSARLPQHQPSFRPNIFILFAFTVISIYDVFFLPLSFGFVSPVIFARPANDTSICLHNPSITHRWLSTHWSFVSRTLHKLDKKMVTKVLVNIGPYYPIRSSQPSSSPSSSLCLPSMRV
jgi:hypothetical protein